MSDASIEATLHLRASSLRDAKMRLRPGFIKEQVAVAAGLFLGGLFGP